MVRISMKAALSVLYGALSFTSVSSIPLEIASHNMSDVALKFVSDAKNSVPAAPHFVIYSDAPVSGQTGPPPVSQIQVLGLFSS